MFEELGPDRSKCKQIYWITGVRNEILAGRRRAKYILNNIILNLERLEEEEEKGFNSNDLVGLIDIFPLLNALQFEQLKCDHREKETCVGALGESLYGDGAFGVASFMFSNTEVWQNITDDEDRFRNSSVLLAQIDEIGALTLKELKLNLTEKNDCSDIDKLYNFDLPNLVFTAKLSQHEKTSKNDFIYKDFEGNWKITVPSKFLPSCASTIGAALSNIPLDENKIFPRYPSEREVTMEKQRGQNFPNGLYPFVVDYTIISHTPVVTDDNEKVVIDFFHEKKVTKSCLEI